MNKVSDKCLGCPQMVARPARGDGTGDSLEADEPENRARPQANPRPHIPGQHKPSDSSSICVINDLFPLLGGANTSKPAGFRTHTPSVGLTDLLRALPSKNSWSMSCKTKIKG
jgi:hypothetical protein